MVGPPTAALSLPVGYLPTDARPWRLTMGLRRLDPSRWLEVDGRRGHELAEKGRLLADHPERVVATRSGSEEAGAALLRAVLDHLRHDHPGTIETLAGEPDAVLDVATGRRIELAGLHPLDAAARLVQEDLCLMEREAASGAWVLTAASVCFPSRWSLADKIGRDLRAIHAPVPGYERQLAAPTDATFDRLTPQRPLWRLNWTLLDRPDLHQPDPGGRRVAAAAPEDLWVRVERQTLRRLGPAPAVTFTIRTYVAPLPRAVAAHPAFGRHLAAVWPTVPATTRAYKGWADTAPPTPGCAGAGGNMEAPCP